MLFFGSIFLVESPRWLVSRDRHEEALQNLCKIRHLSPEHEYIKNEYSAIENAIAHERSLAGAGFLGPLKTVFSSSALIQRLLIGASLFAWQNATGINAINYYSYVCMMYCMADVLLKELVISFLQANNFSLHRGNGDKHGASHHWCLWH
jgi:hypothetical protein